ncbi:MAG: hypothetical protein JHC33_00545, partial [Ignisphaera sp.]|nr:hypothetical protein [Ignisphaera sp.]
MLTLKQQLEALLIEAKAKTKPAPVAPLPEPEEDELDDEEDELGIIPDDEGVVDREALLVKGEVPEDEAPEAEEETELTLPDDYDPDALDKEVKEEEALKAAGKPVKWDSERGYPDTVRRFIKFFLDRPTRFSKHLTDDLKGFIEEGFDPDSRGPFKVALETVLEFYDDFRQSLINKEPTGVIIDLLEDWKNKKPTDEELFRWDPEAVNPEMAKENKKALATLNKSASRDANSIAKWISNSTATSKSIAPLTKEDLDVLFIGVNITHNYLYYKYANMAQWEKQQENLRKHERVTARKKSKGALSDKEQEEEDEIDSLGTSIRRLNLPHESTRIFDIGFDPTKEQDPKDQGYFFTNYFKALYSPAKPALQKFARSNSGALNTITQFLGPIDPKLLEESLNLDAYLNQLVTESLLGDVGDKDILTDQFSGEMTLWFLVALLFGEPKESVFGKSIVRTLKTISPMSYTGLTSNMPGTHGAPNVSAMDAINPETGSYRSADIGAVNAVTGAPDQELTLDRLVYDKFWDTVVALATVFNVGKNPSSLNRVIAMTFAKVPTTSFSGDCDYFKVTPAGDITPANLLSEYQAFAGDNTKDSEYVVSELG